MNTQHADVIDYFVDQGAPEEAPKATLERLISLAEQHKELEEEVHRDTVALEEKKAKLDRLSQDTIPTVMDELGMADFKLKSGETVEVQSKIRASISEENKPAAFGWLREHGFDGIIKSKVEASFGKGEDEEAAKAVAALEAIGVYAARNESVHPQTLASFVRERLEDVSEGHAVLPVSVFGVFEQRFTKISLPKTRKNK